MKTTLIMATTVNGYIAGDNDDTDWVKDFDLLYKRIVDYKYAVMGKRTYLESAKYNVFPYKGAVNIVMTHEKKLHAKSQNDVIFTAASPGEIIKLVNEKGGNQLLVIGGGLINGSFLKENLIDEIILDIHPIIMDKGIRLFESKFPYKNLELVDVKQINDQIVQVRYKLKKVARKM